MVFHYTIVQWAAKENVKAKSCRIGTVVTNYLVISGAKSSPWKQGTPSYVRHTLATRNFTQLTFLFLLPSAPISVTGHQHCKLGATPAPHPGTSSRQHVHTFMRNTHTHLRFEEANYHSVATICSWSGCPVQNVIDMAT